MLCLGRLLRPPALALHDHASDSIVLTKSNTAEKQVSCLPYSASGSPVGLPVGEFRSGDQLSGLTTLGHIGAAPVKAGAAEASFQRCKIPLRVRLTRYCRSALAGLAHERLVRFSPARGMRAGLASTLPEHTLQEHKGSGACSSVATLRTSETRNCG
jgi:hypothetical protein